MLLDARLPTLARWVACAREHEVDAPVVDLAEGELAFRAGDRTRSEALGLQAARRFGDRPCAHVTLLRAWPAPAPTGHAATTSPSTITSRPNWRPALSKMPKAQFGVDFSRSSALEDEQKASDAFRELDLAARHLGGWRTESRQRSANARHPSWRYPRTPLKKCESLRHSCLRLAIRWSDRRHSTPMRQLSSCRVDIATPKPQRSRSSNSRRSIGLRS